MTRALVGRRQLVLCGLLLCVALSPRPASADEVRVELAGELDAASAARLDLYALERSSEGGWSVARVARGLRASLQQSVLDLPSPEGKRLLLDGADVRSAPCVVAEGVCRLEVEPADRRSLRLVDGDGRSPELPEALVATAWRHGSEDPRALVLCRGGGQEGVWSCGTPPGDVDLRLDLAGFAPAFVWRAESGAAASGQPIELRLEPGARVEGWLQAEAGSARLVPAGRWRDITEDRLAFAALDTAISRDGGFRFGNVAPGRYDLTIETPDHGDARAEVVVDRKDEVVVLEDLVLSRSETVEVQVDPPLDGQGEPWQVTVSEVGAGPGAAPRRIALDLTGFGRIEGVRPGRYYVVVRDSTRSVWHLAAHELDGEGPLVLAIPHVPVSGRIRAGDEGLATTLVFGTTQGPKQVRFDSDERGRFTGYLPSEGLWEVELGDEASGCDQCGGELGVTLLPPVEVEVGPSGKAIVDIVLPDTLVEGRVVRGSPGKEAPVAGAQVVAVRPDGPSDRIGRLAQVWTDEEGRFRLRGIEPGRLELGARTDTGAAGASIDLREGGKQPEVELRIEDAVALELRVVDSGGPAAGAQVHAFPNRGFSAHGVTDLDGGVTLQVRARSSGTLLVDPPGRGLTLVAFTTGDEPPPPREIVCPEAMGNLLFEGLPAPPYHGSLGRGDAAVDLHAFRNFARGRVETTPSGVLFLGLAAGEYSLCLGSGGHCSHLTVPPGGTVSVPRPEVKEAAR